MFIRFDSSSSSAFRGTLKAHLFKNCFELSVSVTSISVPSIDKWQRVCVCVCSASVVLCVEDGLLYRFVFIVVINKEESLLMP